MGCTHWQERKSRREIIFLTVFFPRWHLVCTPAQLLSKLKHKKLKRLFNNTLQNNRIELHSNSYQVCGSLKWPLSREQIKYTITNWYKMVTGVNGSESLSTEKQQEKPGLQGHLILKGKFATSMSEFHRPSSTNGHRKQGLLKSDEILLAKRLNKMLSDTLVLLWNVDLY